MSTFSDFFSVKNPGANSSSKLEQPIKGKARRNFLVGGGIVILGFVGLITTLWLNQTSQDTRQQASELSYITLAAEVRNEASQKGLVVNDAEVRQIAEKVNKVKNSKQAVKLARSGAVDQTAAPAPLTWEPGLTKIALEKVKNPNYSPFTNLEPKLIKFASIVGSGEVPDVPAETSVRSGGSALANLSLGSQLAADAVLPASYDWRTAHGGNFLTTVKDQGLCGSCWAFSGNATLEIALGAYFNQPSKKVDLSEQNLLSCSTNTTGCQGTISLAGDYHVYAANSGVVTESCMAYQGCDQSIASCACPAGAKCAGTPAVYKGSYGAVPIVWADLSNQIVDAYGTAQNIKRAIIEHGGVDTGLVVYDDFELYVNGVYQRSSTSAFSGGHAISIIGWGTENGQPYWLIKNSWSNLWGINGYGKYKMLGGSPGSTIDLNAVYTNYKNIGGPDFGIEGMAGLYAYIGEPLLLYIDTPSTQNDTITRACTDRDNDGYCFWGFGSAKPASGCPASCASRATPDCDDGRNTIGANCLAITVSPTTTPAPTNPAATATPTRVPTATPTQVPSATPTQAALTPINPEAFCSSHSPGGTTKLAIGQCADSSWAYQFNFPSSESNPTACKTYRIEYCGKGNSGPNYTFKAPVAGQVVVYYKSAANVTAQLKSGTTTKTLNTASSGKWQTGLTVTANQVLDFTVNMGDPPMLGWVSPVGNTCKGSAATLGGLDVTSLNTQTTADGVVIASKQCWGDGSSFEAGGPNAGTVSLTYSTVGKTVAIRCNGSTKNCRQAYFEDMDFNDGAFWIAIIPSSPSPTTTPIVTATPNPTATINPNNPNITTQPSPTGTLILDADVNEDGVVNQTDLTIVLNNYGKNPLINPRADVNKDGRVNAIDYVYVLDYYGQSTQ